MPNVIDRRRLPQSEMIAFAIPAVLYLAIAVPVGFRQRAAINPDGIIYIRKAQALMAGEFWQSVSGYWSPAISWCVAIVMRLCRGIDPLHAIHGVLVFFGLTWVIAACALLRLLLPAHPRWRIVAGISIALTGVRQAIGLITPDLLLGTMLMAYLAMASSVALLRSRKRAVFCGAFAGLGYLCKSYALPFFCLHFPLTLAYRYWRSSRNEKRNVGRADLFRTLLLGFLGLAIPVLPWVGLLTAKYGRFTISMVYHHNHINVAEESVQERLPDFCVVPPDPYLSIWEGLDPGPRSDWSPLSSKRNFLHQLEIAVDHAWLIIASIVKFDGIGLVLLAAVACLIPFRLLTGRPMFSPVPIWIVMTGCVYCIGFLIVAFEVRYIVPILFPLGIVLCLREWADFKQGYWPDGDPKWPAVVPFLLAGVFVVSSFVAVEANLFDSPARPLFAQVAELLRSKHLDQTFTSNDNNRGVNLSYFLHQKIVMLPHRDAIETIQRKLADTGVKEMVVWTDSRAAADDAYPGKQAAMLLQTGHWTRVLGKKLDSVRRVDVYIRNGDVQSAAPERAEQPD